MALDIYTDEEELDRMLERPQSDKDRKDGEDEKPAPEEP